MSDKIYDVFISYRRDGGFETAKHLNDLLCHDGYSVSFDIDTLREGDFDKALLARIEQCVDFILIVDKHCFDKTLDNNNKPEEDWLRTELAYALELKKNIIPVLLPNASFPDGLPKDIERVPRKNGPKYSKDYYDMFYKKLRSMLHALPRNGIGGSGSLFMSSCANLKVQTNLDCVMYIDGDRHCILTAGKLHKIPLSVGEYMLKFVGLDNEQDRITDDSFVMPNNDKLYKVDLVSLKRDRIALEQEIEREEGREKKKKKEKEEDGVFYVNGVSFKMVKVIGGTFMMGATEEQGTDAVRDERPAHQVTLSDYYIGETAVTQRLWTAVMGGNPSQPKSEDLPVNNVSWEDAQIFIRNLSIIIGRKFRLPTEAEWEYAARGGSKSKKYKYSGSNNLDEVAWYDKNCGSKLHPVKCKKANELGLFDMSGNVWEWCNDWYRAYSEEQQTDPKGPIDGSNKVIRGGGWKYYARVFRVSNRGNYAPSYRNIFTSLRLVMDF